MERRPHFSGIIAPRPLAIAIACIASALGSPIAGSARPLDVSVAGGPGQVTGEGGRAYARGQVYALRAGAPSDRVFRWALQVSFEDHDIRAVEMPAIQTASGGDLYVPYQRYPGQSHALSIGTLELGARRVVPVGAVRPFVEAATGPAWVVQSGTHGPPLNDRRAGGGFTNVVPATRSWSPGLSIGVGVEAPLPGRITVAASIAGRWMPVRDVSGPTVPVLLGVTWPTAPRNLRDDPPGPHAPELRVSGGATALRAPFRLRGDTQSGAAMAVELVLPATRSFSLSFRGEQALRREHVPGIVRQTTDSFGNLVNETVDVPISFTTAVLTLGARMSGRIGPIECHGRAGAGWGRTGGFGRTITEATGLAVQDSVLVPVYTTYDVGSSSPASGFAASGSLGVDRVLRPGLSVFAEAGVTNLRLPRDDVTLVPIRLGIALR